MVKTLHKYKYIHKLFVRTAEVPVHKFSNCIATQSISTVRQKPQHEFRLITAHLHVHTNMYICICTHFEIRAVGTRAGDTSNERLQGANENYNEMHFTVTTVFHFLNQIRSELCTVLCALHLNFEMNIFAENPVHRNVYVSQKTTKIAVTNYTSNLKCEHLFMRSSANAKKYVF